jgi:tetratricopeptide (TPR) repeat protein
MPKIPEEFDENSNKQPELEILSHLAVQRLANEIDTKRRSQIEMAVLDWLYDFVRANVKRGRAFELDEVIASQHADCLGYAKLLNALSFEFGLNLGIIEVLIDNAAEYVPHHINILNLSNGTYRFIDIWYGSKDINHQRIAALVDGKPGDIGREELDKIKHIEGLPEYCLEAITFYIQGNRCLERNKLDEAVDYYTKAIEMYPNNTRAFYNRALAFERKGEISKAEEDYLQAFKDEGSLARVLARVDRIERLIELDEKSISEREQDIYLWHKGFKTGKEVGFEEIAQKYGIPKKQAEEIVSKIDRVRGNG